MAVHTIHWMVFLPDLWRSRHSASTSSESHLQAMRWSNRRWMWDGDSGSQGTRVIFGFGAPIVAKLSGNGELKG